MTHIPHRIPELLIKKTIDASATFVDQQKPKEYFLIIRTNENGEKYLEAVEKSYKKNFLKTLAYKIRNVFPGFTWTNCYKKSNIKEFLTVEFSNMASSLTSENNEKMQQLWDKLFEKDPNRDKSEPVALPPNGSLPDIPSSNASELNDLLLSTSPQIGETESAKTIQNTVITIENILDFAKLAIPYIEQLRGIVNGSNYCYLISVIKALKTCPTLVEQIEILASLADSDNAAKDLYEFFAKLYGQGPEESAIELLINELAKNSEFKDPPRSINILSGAQQDAAEFCGMLLKACKLPKFTIVDSLVDPMPDPEEISIMEVITRTEPDRKFSLSDIFLGIEQEGPAQGERIQIYQRIVGEAPQVLPIQIHRGMKQENGENVKDQTVIDIPLILRVPVFNKDKETIETYLLRSVIVHAGQVSSNGHYYTYIPNPECLEQKENRIMCNSWILHDDKTVKNVDNKNTINIFKGTTVEQDIESNAYLVFYEKVALENIPNLR